MIRNVGPISFADIELKRINVVIGLQSQGKSTLLKIASFCVWLEKRIEQSLDSLQNTFDRKRILQPFIYFSQTGGIHPSGLFHILLRK